MKSKYLYLILLLTSLLLVSCTTDICKFKYTEPDESWYYATFNIENVVSYHSASTKRGTVYWIVYTDLDCEWDNQIISMDRETYYTLLSILDNNEEDIELSILYKEHYQPVLIIVDRD